VALGQRARLRRNQRNSRARKQAYVQDLEDRWSGCVKLGAQATVEMQREARRVQDENRLLRAVLHRRGFDDRAIQLAMDEERQASTTGGTSQLSTPCEAVNGPTYHGGGISSELGADKMTFASSRPGSDVALGVRPTTDSLTAAAGPGIDQDLSQVLGLQDWLNDLCDIKDAFGAEAYVSTANNFSSAL
jgi:hypothetical protein